LSYILGVFAHTFSVPTSPKLVFLFNALIFLDFILNWPSAHKSAWRRFGLGCYDTALLGRTAILPEKRIMWQSYLEKVLNARVYDVAVESPLEVAPILSERLGNRVLLKREDLQPVFSFKLRGAFNKLVKLTPAERAKGVVAASAGNHAQGLALAAQHLGCKAVIVMPRTTPLIKVEAVRRRGAKAVLHGDAYDDAYEYAQQLVAEKGMTFIHPFDDVDVIAGQGTVGMEILRQHPDPIDAIFIPVGGGGLVAGVAAYVKHLRPEIKIIGVEPEDSPTLERALAKGKRVELERVGIFADGVAVRKIGKETFKVAKDCVDEVILVSSDELCAAIKDIFDDTRSIAEPAGALGVAGVKKYVERYGITDQTLVAINSGANTNFDRLRHVAERAELGERREALLAVTVPERPGSFLNFCRTLGQRFITEFNYRYADAETAHVFAGIKLDDGVDARHALIERLVHEGYPVVDLTDNEMAKLHVAHMVGGHGGALQDERVFRFEFPERPGALLNFLIKLGRGWNISLFHYRNHGAADGQVLAGIQVPRSDYDEFQAFLDGLGYAYTEETSNPAYRLFLR
jgi:threonine dehydratase